MQVDRLRTKLEESRARNEELARELKFSEEARLAVQDREHVALQKAKAAEAAAVAAASIAPARALPASMSAAQQQKLAERIARTAVEADYATAVGVDAGSAPDARGAGLVRVEPRERGGRAEPAPGLDVGAGRGSCVAHVAGAYQGHPGQYFPG